MYRPAAPSNVQLPPKLGSSNARVVNEHPETSIYRPSAARTRSSSSIASVASIQSASTPVHVYGASSSSQQQSGSRYATASAYAAYPARDSPGASSNRSSNTTQEEIESSLRQWREHVFPSLKAGNYISPAGDTPDRERGASFIEPILPDIFNTTNAEAYITTYSTGREFIDDCSHFANTERETEGDESEEEEPEQQLRYADNWRMEMVLGQTSDAVSWDERTQAIWMNVWSGREEDGTRLLECCLCKFPGRPVVLASPIPIDLLPTALLQYRMRQLLEAFLSHPSVSQDHPFSVVMGPTRLVDAFLLHHEMEPYLPSSAHFSSYGSAQLGPQRQQTLLASSTSPTPTQAAQLASSSSSCSVVKSVKPLVHTLCNTLPPAVSLSEGFAVRLAQPTDDLTTLGTLFQHYSATLDVQIDEHQARQALLRAMHTNSVWIYHVYSQSLPGLHLIAGFLTTERLRRTSSGKEGKRKGGSIAITAVYTEENYRKRGVAESLVRAATRYYMSGKEGTCNTPAALPSKKASSSSSTSSSRPTTASSPPKDDENKPDKGNIDYISVFVDARAESAISLFSRVGYGVGERETVQDIPVASIRNCLKRQVAELEKAQEQEIIHISASVRELGDESLGSGSEDVGTDDGVHTPIAERSLPPAHVKGQGNTAQHPQDSEQDKEADSIPDARLTCRSKEPWQIVTIVRKPHGVEDASVSPNPNFSPSGTKRFGGRRDAKRLSLDRPWL